MRAMYAIAFVASAALSGLVTYVPQARASGSRMYPATSCTGGSSQSVLTYTTKFIRPGMIENTSGEFVQLFCPVLQGTDFPPSAANGVTVYGSQPASTFSTVSIAACVTYTNGTGGKCGALTDPPASGGNFAQKVQDMSAWPTTFPNSDLLVLLVGMNTPTNGVPATLFGYTVNN
jgi:hypothetical protein